MRPNDSKESVSRLISRASSTSDSMKVKSVISDKTRKPIILLTKPKQPFYYKRQTMRVIDNGENVTPKPLIHPEYSVIEEKQLSAFDNIGTSINGSNTLLNVLSSVMGGHRLSSYNVMSSSFHTALLGGEEIHMDSLLSTEKVDESDIEEDKAPSEFQLSRLGSSVFDCKPERLTITLKETETFFIFEMPQLTADKTTPEGAAVEAANERYIFITVGAGANRKLADAETQTPQIHTKVQGTYIGRHTRRNQGTFVSNWEMYDTYQQLHTMKEVNGMLYPRRIISRKKKSDNRQCQNEVKVECQSEVTSSVSQENELLDIYCNTSFREAARVMLRILASNLYITAQKRFTGLIKQDPYAMDLQFTYSLDLLWVHSTKDVIGRSVTCFCWSYENSSVLAVGYNSCSRNPEVKDGLVMIWCAKNPSHFGRKFLFDCPVSSLNWSKKRPNLLAVAFYNGIIKVIDVKSKDLLVLRQSERESSPSFEPHWQVQWWSENDLLDTEESIFTSNQDGRVFCYRTGEDFICTEVMKIPRIEGKIEGVKRTVHGIFYDVPISRNPGALVLRKHPTLATIYFVGTDEGCIHRCSTNYLHQHIESFLAHDGPIYSMEFSPLCSKIFLTAGADWCTRIWVEGITEPLITLSTKMAWVRCATWCPTNSTVIATIVNNEICIWDIKKKIYKPTSITVLPRGCTLLLIEFTKNGNQLVVADNKGTIYIYNLEGMPFPPFDQVQVLTSSIEKALVTKPSLLKKFKKLRIT